MPTTKKQRDAYAAKLRQISRNFDRLERETLQQSIKLLKDVRNKVAGELTGTEFSQFRVKEQQKAIDEIIDEYETQLRAMTNGAARQSFTLGGQSAVEPLQAAGINARFFTPSKAQVEVIAQFSADLIGDYVQGAARRDINRIIRMNALAGNSSLDAMKEITTKLFGSDRVPKPTDLAKGVAYEAERILRTEVNRSYNLAAFSQQEKLAKDIPGLQKQWLATGDNRTRLSHLQAHGKVVPVGDPFIVGGAELMYPLDPAGPPQETIQCRCDSITVIPEIGPLETPLDDEIEKELAARDKEKARKARARFKVADEIALIEKGAVDPFAAIRPPAGRAPRGLGGEYKMRRGIVSKIETQMKFRGQAQKQLDQFRGQKGTRNRWKIDVAEERVKQLNKGISATLDIASDTITDDWIFKSEIVDGIFKQVSAMRT